MVTDLPSDEPVPAAAAETSSFRTRNERPSTSGRHEPRRGLGGLGRGLAGILEPVADPTEQDQQAAAGLGNLLGHQARTRATSVRGFVVETALAAIAEAFDADGVVMASRERSAAKGPSADQRPSLTLRLPPSWGTASPALFELYGVLWEMLNVNQQIDAGWSPSEQSLTNRQGPVDAHWAWFCRLDDGNLAVAAALVRAEPFDDDEAEALARSMRSVAASISPRSTTGDRGLIRAKVVTNVAVTSDIEGDDMANAITAEVTVQGDRSFEEAGFSVTAPGEEINLASLTATGRGPSIETAVARAAANACQPQCQVRFAGASDLDGNTISIVIVSDETGSPRLGVSIRPVGDYTGIAEAVFSAASSGGIPRQG